MIKIFAAPNVFFAEPKVVFKSIKTANSTPEPAIHHHHIVLEKKKIAEI